MNARFNCGVLGVAMLTAACSSLNTQRYRDEVFTLKRLAVVSIAGPAEIKVPWNRSDEHLFNAKDLRPRGPALAKEAARHLRTTLEKDLKLDVVAVSKVTSHKAYKTYDGPAADASMASPEGMRALDHDASADARLGKLAHDLGVDGVVLAVFQWELEVEETEREVHEKGYSTVRVVVVDAAGQRLVDTLHTGYADEIRHFKEKKDGINIGVALFGTGGEDKAYASVLQAATRAVDGFATTWKDKKPVK